MSAKPIPLSILLPWKDRSELEYTLHENRVAFETAGAEVLVLNSGGDREALVTMLRRVDLPCVRLVETGLTWFNKSKSLNLGASFARASRLMVLDADILLPAHILEEMLALLSSGSFVTVQWMHECCRDNARTAVLTAVTETVRATVMEFPQIDGSTRSAVTFRYGLKTQRRSAQSLLLLNKYDFLAVNGFHSGIQSWGWEDNDLFLRLQWSAGLTNLEYGIVQHLSHDDLQRELQGRSQMDSLNQNLLAAAARYENGDLSGTYAADRQQMGGASFEVDLIHNAGTAWQR